MANCILFCAAEFDALAQPIGEDDFLIAADGGLRHVQALGLTPDAVIGDFDSLGYVPEQAVVYPVEKDDTDAMLAVKLGLERGFRRFVIYGGMDGKRLDHTVANFQTLSFLARQCRSVLHDLHFHAKRTTHILGLLTHPLTVGRIRHRSITLSVQDRLTPVIRLDERDTQLLQFSPKRGSNHVGRHDNILAF